MKILLIDSGDSFTHVLSDIIGDDKQLQVTLIDAAKTPPQPITAYDKFIICADLAAPAKKPLLAALVAACINYNKPLLGINRGFMAICQHFGAALLPFENAVHGQQKELKIDNNSPIYAQLPALIKVGLYHAKYIKMPLQPPAASCLKVSSSLNGKIMSLEHRQYKIYALQFNPESFLTPLGGDILSNFLYNT